MYSIIVGINKDTRCYGHVPDIWSYILSHLYIMRLCHVNHIRRYIVVVFREHACTWKWAISLTEAACIPWCFWCFSSLGGLSNTTEARGLNFQLISLEENATLNLWVRERWTTMDAINRCSLLVHYVIKLLAGVDRCLLLVTGRFRAGSVRRCWLRVRTRFASGRARKTHQELSHSAA